VNCLLAALISYPQWQHIPVKDQDQTFVSMFLQEALDIMTRVWRQQTLRTEKALFSVIPKKVKEVGQFFNIFYTMHCSIIANENQQNDIYFLNL
jgi:hypothetical protein